MAFIEKDINGNTVLSVNFADIPAFVESNPDHPSAGLMLTIYDIETEAKAMGLRH